MMNDKGDKLHASIPKQHTTHETKNAYLQGHVDGHSRAQTKSNIILILSILVNICLASLLLYCRR